MAEEKIIVKTGDELVTFAKNVAEDVSKLRIGADVDYHGCSTNYIYEKVNRAIEHLEWIIDRVAELNNEIVRCEECKTFTSELDNDNLCYGCSDDEEFKEDAEDY